MRGRSEPVAPQLVRAARRRRPDVQERRAVRASTPRSRRRRDRLGGRARPSRRAERDGVPLVAVEVDADRREPMVRREPRGRRPSRTRGPPPARSRRARPARRGRRGRRGTRRPLPPTAVDRVAAALEGPLVVPPRRPSGRARVTSVSSILRDDLVVDRAARARRSRASRRGELVLGGQVREDRGIVAIAEPEVVVDAIVAEVGERRRARWGDGQAGSARPAACQHRPGGSSQGIGLLLWR